MQSLQPLRPSVNIYRPALPSARGGAINDRPLVETLPVPLPSAGIAALLGDDDCMDAKPSGKLP